jgi:hypothetical protein
LVNSLLEVWNEKIEAADDMGVGEPGEKILGSIAPDERREPPNILV